MAKSVSATDIHDTQDTGAIYIVIARCLGVPRKQLTEKTSLVEDLGADSIDSLSLAADLEEAFGVVITDRDICRFRTIGDVIVCVVGMCKVRSVTERGTNDVAADSR